MKKTIFITACMLLFGSISYAQSISISSTFYDDYVDAWEVYNVPYNGLSIDLAAGRDFVFGSQGGAVVGYDGGAKYVITDANAIETYSGSVTTPGSSYDLYVWGSYGGWGTASVAAY